MYISAISAPEAKIARGNVRCGSRTSSLIAETSSRPVNANAICGQKFTVSQSQCGSIAAHVKCVTDPCRAHSSSATPTIIISGTYVPTPPAFCSHLPMCKPDDVQPHRDNQHHKRSHQQKCAILRQPCGSGAADVGGHRRAGQQQVRENKKRCKSSTSIRRRIRENRRTPSFVQTYSPPSSGNRVESSTTTNAVGTKNRSAASIHRLIEDCPLRAAAAIHRGPSTVAMQNSSTSQKPITRRNCCFASGSARRRLAHEVTSSSGISSSWRRKLRRNGSGAASNPAHGPKYATRPRAETRPGRRVFSPGACRA